MASEEERDFCVYLTVKIYIVWEFLFIMYVKEKKLWSQLMVSLRHLLIKLI